MDNRLGKGETTGIAGSPQAVAALVRLLRCEAPEPVRLAQDAPASGGAYALLIELARSIECRLAGGTLTFAPGLYVYAGNAYGPGGIRARLRRHFSKAGKMHWHIDWLTNRAARMEAFALAAGSECKIIRSLLDSRLFAAVHAGFGSSDCRSCPAHLLRWLEPVRAWEMEPPLQ